MGFLIHTENNSHSQSNGIVFLLGAIFNILATHILHETDASRLRFTAPDISGNTLKEKGPDQLFRSVERKTHRTFERL
jgi:hypothetical protein